jgi:UDP-N-acetylglucosamine--N-acetylmuramyl-(pentapeptide) pyrophosphoryl-undecaprenol N-acetylglucosamine transferase
VAYEGMEKYFPAEKIVITGNPIREEIVTHLTKKDLACRFFNIPSDKPVVLILGGSLGAKTLNDSIIRRIDTLEKENIQVLWQTGKLYIEKIRQELQSKNLKHILYFDFINRMDMAYSAADIIISRAGAATISELCLLGKPAILVPSPNVAEDHQTKNAMALVRNEAAIMVRDIEARETLVLKTLELLHNTSMQKKLGANCSNMALHGSTAMIVDEIFKLVNVN